MLNFWISFLKIQQFLSYKGLFIFSSTWDIHFSISQWNHCYCHFLNNCYLPFAFSIHFYYLWVISDPLWIWYKGLLPLTLSSIHLIHWNRYNRRMVCISNMYVIHVWTPSAHYSHCTCFKTGRRCQIYTLEYVSH